MNDELPIPPSRLLTDGVIELRLRRVMGKENASLRPPDEQFLAHVPEYRFAIHRLSDGLRVGRIHIRATNDQDIVHLIGHCGYAVDEAHRGHGYATLAVKLVAGLAEYWQIQPLWIFMEPGNTASRRTVERAGLELVDVIESPVELVDLGVGPRVCRYRSPG